MRLDYTYDDSLLVLSYSRTVKDPNDNDVSVSLSAIQCIGHEGSADGVIGITAYKGEDSSGIYVEVSDSATQAQIDSIKSLCSSYNLVAV